MWFVLGRMGRWRRVASLLWLGTTRVVPTGPGINGLGVDLGGGRVVQLYCESSQPELVVVDVGGMGWRRVWSGLCASTSRVMTWATAARALLGRIWCCLGVLETGLPLLTLCVWRRRTLRRGRMSGATPSRTCIATAIPVLWAARSCSSTTHPTDYHLKMRVGR